MNRIKGATAPCRKFQHFIDDHTGEHDQVFRTEPIRGCLVEEDVAACGYLVVALPDDTGQGDIRQNPHGKGRIAQFSRLAPAFSAQPDELLRGVLKSFQHRLYGAFHEVVVVYGGAGNLLVIDVFAALLFGAVRRKVMKPNYPLVKLPFLQQRTAAHPGDFIVGAGPSHSGAGSGDK